jgi:hypothetical protein
VVDQARLRRRYGDDPEVLNGRLVVVAEEDSVRAVARKHGLCEWKLLLLNRGHIPALLPRTRLRAGTHLLLPVASVPVPSRAGYTPANPAAVRWCVACAPAAELRLLPPWDARFPHYDSEGKGKGRHSTGCAEAPAKSGWCWRAAYGLELCGCAAAAAGADELLLGARVLVTCHRRLLLGTVAGYRPLQPGHAAAGGGGDWCVQGLYRVVVECSVAVAAIGGSGKVESWLVPLPCPEVTSPDSPT